MYKYILLALLCSCASVTIPVIDSDYKQEVDETITSLYRHAKNEMSQDESPVLPVWIDGESYISLDWLQGSDMERLQAAIDSEAYYVIIPKRVEPWVIEPLYITRSLHLVLEQGVVIEASRDSFYGTGDSLINILNCKDVFITGYGAVLKMFKDDYLSEKYEWSEWRMGITIKSAHNVFISGVTVLDSGGDGIYIGSFRKEDRTWAEASSNIHIRDVVLHNHYRQGISVISVDGLVIDNVYISNTSGTAPAAGIDFEPNNKDQLLKNITILNSDIRNNQGPGILLYLGQLDEDSSPVDIKVYNTNVDNWPLSVHIAGTGKNPRGLLLIEDSTLSGFFMVETGENLTFEEIEN